MIGRLSQVIGRQPYHVSMISGLTGSRKYGLAESCSYSIRKSGMLESNPANSIIEAMR